jgi:hypothetical protein
MSKIVRVKHILFSTFISRPTSLLVSIKVTVLSSCYLCYLLVDSHHQHKLQADVSHLISFPLLNIPNGLF